MTSQLTKNMLLFCPVLCAPPIPPLLPSSFPQPANQKVLRMFEDIQRLLKKRFNKIVTDNFIESVFSCVK